MARHLPHSKWEIAEVKSLTVTCNPRRDSGTVVLCLDLFVNNGSVSRRLVVASWCGWRLGEGFVRTNIGVQMVVETIKRVELLVAEVAFIALSGPRRLVRSKLHRGGTRQISKYRPSGDSVLGVLGPHQFVHLVAVHVGRAAAVAVLDVFCDCAGICLRVGAKGALDDAVTVGTRVQMLEGFRSAKV
jgi:hypothetical protein